MFLFLQPTPTSGPSPNWGRGAGEGAFARMAELVDALVSGTSVRKDVQVRVLFRVQLASRNRGFQYFFRGQINLFGYFSFF